MKNFFEFVAGIFGVSAECLSAETAYGQLPQWDSVMHLRLMMEIEAHYGVDIPLDEIPRMTTLGIVWRKIEGSVPDHGGLDQQSF